MTTFKMKNITDMKQTHAKWKTIFSVVESIHSKAHEKPNRLGLRTLSTYLIEGAL